MNALTQYQVREQFQKATCHEINPDRLKELAEWGLVEHRPDDLWGPTTVERLIQIRELGKSVDSYARRVILLNGQQVGETNDRFEVPTECLRAAMLERALKIRPHLRKVKRLESSIRLVFARGEGSPMASPLPKGWKPPHREEWPKLLARLSTDQFAQVAGWQYYALGLLKTFDTDLSGMPLNEIPDDELLILLTVRQIAAMNDSIEGLRVEEGER
ncbi:MAG: hypothetical protein WBA63_09315 [Thermomicrobiales bacterium]